MYSILWNGSIILKCSYIYLIDFLLCSLYCGMVPLFWNVLISIWLTFYYVVYIVELFHYSEMFLLTHWGPVTDIWDGKLTIIGSDNGLSPGWRQAIIWTNAGILLNEPLGTNFSEILIGIQIFSFKKMRLKMLSAKWRPFCLGLNVLTHLCLVLQISESGQHWLR